MRSGNIEAALRDVDRALAIFDDSERVVAYRHKLMSMSAR